MLKFCLSPRYFHLNTFKPRKYKTIPPYLPISVADTISLFARLKTFEPINGEKAGNLGSDYSFSLLCDPERVTPCWDYRALGLRMTPSAHFSELYECVSSNFFSFTLQTYHLFFINITPLSVSLLSLLPSWSSPYKYLDNRNKI